MADELKGWQKIIQELVKKIKAEILVFVVLIVIVVALLGERVPKAFELLVYLLALGGMLLYGVLYVVSRFSPSGQSHPDRPEKPIASPPPPPSEPPPKPEPEPAEPGPSPRTTPDAARTAYLRALVADCQRARLVGLDPKAADPGRGGLSLDRLYVSLDTTARLEAEEDRKPKRRRDRAELTKPEESRPLSALEATQREQRIVLLGLPGSGKSTFLRYLSLRMAQALLDPDCDLSEQLPGWGTRPLLPVIVPLGVLASSMAATRKTGDAEMIEQFLERGLDADERTRGCGPQLLRALQEQGGLVLFDGLDEVPSLEARQAVVGAVEQFVSRYGGRPRTRFLVTCRTFSYTDAHWKLSGWPTYELAPLSPDKIEQFVDAWHAEHVRIDSARKADYEDKRTRMLESLRPGDRRRLHEVADNPLILTVMAVVHTHRGELPDTRAQVYEECVGLLLERWELERSASLGAEARKRSILEALALPAPITLYRALWEIAYRAHASRAAVDGEERGEQAAIVTEDLVAGVLHAAFGQADKVQNFLEYCEGANGLLMLQGVAPLPGAPSDARPRKVYAFPHLTFQEYLASRHLLNLGNLGQSVRSHIARGERWREVMMFLGEHILFREGDFERMDCVLQALAPRTEPTQRGPDDWRALWMAGDLLMLYRRARQGKPGADESICRGLCELLEHGALTARERAAAGDALARLDDPRFRPDAWFLPADDQLGFVEVPAGPFLMGSDPTTGPAAPSYERPQHELSLRCFYMARYPVTVAQFRAFVEEAGHTPDSPESLSGLPNHPVVYVTWHEAMKYCEWLTAKLREWPHTPEPFRTLLREGQEGGKPWRIVLPSEAEWEKAARGTDGRIFPWGNDFDDEKANVAMTVGRTSAVGAFPRGASSFRSLDMCGNVWEWTRSLWGSDFRKPDFGYPYDRSDGREQEDAPNTILRVLRGGAFYYNPEGARCAYRLRDDPYDRYFNAGFRLLLSPYL